MALFEDMIPRIEHPKAFVSARAGGQVASIAYGVVVGGLLVVESVATAPAMRNQGLARQALLRLVEWAVEQGAQSGVLQVLAANAPAHALYRRLGFVRHLFDYRYWRREL